MHLACEPSVAEPRLIVNMLIVVRHSICDGINMELQRICIWSKLSMVPNHPKLSLLLPNISICIKRSKMVPNEPKLFLIIQNGSE